MLFDALTGFLMVDPDKDCLVFRTALLFLVGCKSDLPAEGEDLLTGLLFDKQVAAVPGCEPGLAFNDEIDLFESPLVLLKATVPCRLAPLPEVKGESFRKGN